MVIYEVNLRVRNEAAEDVALWLPRHIGRILGFEGFLRATWYYREAEGDVQQWTVVYHVSNRRLLQRYLETGAAEMRRETSDHFGDAVQGDRRILFERETFGRPGD